jgi:putative membrane protein
VNDHKLAAKRLAALATIATTAVLTLPQPAQAAEGDDVDVVNTETVQVYTDASGDVQSRRVYEQLALTGEGTVDLSNPVETNGLRNLNEFGGFDVEGDDQVVTMSVDGEEHLRSVSDYTGDLPLKVEATYFLDGEEVEPGDVVGESGELQVVFKVTNVTAQPQEVTYTDGSGGTVTKTVDVPIPMVGSLSTTAPSNFTDVESEQANLAGDGTGGTKLSFTMTLFPPLGSDTAEFGYTANITDGVVPRAEVSALPVNPLESPTFKTASDSYEGGADTGEQLAAGATEIDSNLLKLRDGSADLLAGLIKLQNGSADLATGLSGEAAPGSARLADGADELLAGTDKLRAGTGRLDDGAGEAHAGGQRLTDGLEQISGGLDQLKGKLPGAQDGIEQLQDGVDQMLAGLGDAGDPTTLIGGLTALEVGLTGAEAGAGRIAGGLSTQLRPGLVQAKGGVDGVKGSLDGALTTGMNNIIAGLNGLQTICDTHPDPTASATCTQTVNSLTGGATGVRNGLGQASGVLGQVSGGLGGAIDGLDNELIPGANLLASRLADAQDGSTDLKNGAVDLKAGVRKVGGGLDQLSDGMADAISGVLRLSSGAGDAVDGSSELTDGLGRLSAGTSELDSGAGELNDGAGRLADGAGDLADGLGAAADGSQQLSDGLGQAADGAPQLVDGTQRLSDEGTKKLAEAGEDTAQEYGELYATIAAGGERADAEKMAYGAPEGATGLTAYSYVVEGESGETGRNWTRGLVGVGLLVAGAGALLLRRRMV